MIRNFTVAEYFAGIGLMGLGLKQDWGVLFANDINPKKYAMFVDFFGTSVNYRVGDINNLDVQDIPTTTLATASFPCIDLSVAGNQKGLAGKHSGTFWGFIRILNEMGARRPPLVLLENVLGWLTAKHGRDFRDSISALNSLGYTCDAFILNAHHFTPQSRPRMFIIGALHYPAYSKREILTQLQLRPTALQSDRLLQSLIRNSDLQWTVHPLPVPPSLGLTFGDIAEDLSPDDPRWWSKDRVNHMLTQISDMHLQKLTKIITSSTVTYATAFKRVRNKQTRAELRTDGIAGCLRTPVGGSSKQIVVAAGNGELRVRWMTEREYARLQGVPDEFPINVPYLQALWGFGDAVCVPAIEWIAGHALVPLAEQVHIPV